MMYITKLIQKNPPASFEYENPNAFIKYTVINEDAIINPKFPPQTNSEYVPKQEVRLVPRDDFIVYNDIEKVPNMTVLKFEKKETDDDIITISNNIHYITGNFIIKNVLNNRQVLDFDLFRIKFNMDAINMIAKNGKMINSFKIPSEFIDVSVTTIYSNSYDEDERVFIMPIEIQNIKLPNIPVKSHSYIYFINDLTKILFTDGNFFPWMKSKYEKRLKRLILLLYLYDLRHKTNYLDILAKLSKISKYNTKSGLKSKINMDKYSMSPVFLDSYQNFNNFYDLVYVNSNYKYIETPVKMILIMSEIFNEKNPLSIINHFRDKIKLFPLTDTTDLKKNYELFLDEIINTYDEIYGSG